MSDAGLMFAGIVIGYVCWLASMLCVLLLDRSPRRGQW